MRFLDRLIKEMARVHGQPGLLGQRTDVVKETLEGCIVYSDVRALADFASFVCSRWKGCTPADGVDDRDCVNIDGFRGVKGQASESA